MAYDLESFVNEPKHNIPFTHEPIYELRDYQIASENGVRTSFVNGSFRTVLCGPTGSGKTVTLCHLGYLTAKKGFVTLAIVDRRELMDQIKKTAEGYGMVVGLITPKTKSIMPAHLYVCMVETLYRRVKKIGGYLNQFGPVKLSICDEAHRGNFQKLLPYLDMWGMRIVGTTATPKMSKAGVVMKDLWADIVEPISIDALIEQGFLVKDDPWSVTHKFKLTKRMGEYTEESQMAEFSKPELVAGLLRNIKKICPTSKGIIYNVRIDHSISTRDELRAAGFTAEHLDGKTPDKERDRIITGFRANEFQWLCNVGVLTAGFDEDSVTAIILNFCTTSTVKYFQCCGRGGRPCDHTVIWNGHTCSLTNDKKTKFYILDMGQNWKRHGAWSDPFSWTQEFYNPRTKTEEKSEWKMCPQCEKLVRCGIMICPNCGYNWPKRNRKAKAVEIAELEQIKKELRKTLPKHLKGRSYSSMDLKELCELANHMGYKDYWVYKRHTENTGRDYPIAKIIAYRKHIRSEEDAMDQAIRKMQKQNEEDAIKKIQKTIDPKERTKAIRLQEGFLSGF